MNNINEILLKYSGKELIVVLDNAKKPWFNAVQVSKILKYVKPQQTINQLVDKEYIKRLKDIVSDIKIFKNAQPHTLFINEYGLYAFLLRSTRKEAKQFFKWIVENVIPDIRHKGYYEANLQVDKQLEDLQNIIEKLYNENLILKNNNKKIPNNTGQYIYVIKSPEEGLSKFSKDEEDILKIGKSGKYKGRLATHNSSHKDNVFVLYRVKVDDNQVVEQCLKALLKKQRYNKKEFFKITLKNAIKNIKKCIRLTKTEKLSEDNYYLELLKKNKLSRYVNNYAIEILFDGEEENEKLIGGSNINNYDDYVLINDMYSKIFTNNIIIDHN